MKKRLICLALAVVSLLAICSCSCIRSENKYDYDMTQYISIPDYKSQTYNIDEDALKMAIGAYLMEYASEYSVRRGDKIQVDIKFYNLVDPAIDKKGEEITELAKENLWIEKVATPNENGDYQLSSQIENVLLNSKMSNTLSKLLTLDNTFYNEAYRGKKVFVDITIKNRVCEYGDVLKASYTGYHIDSNNQIVKENGNEKIFDSSDNSAFYIGSHLAIDDFEKGLEGMILGEEKNIYATFPEDYEPEPSLAGKKVLFKVKIKSFFIPPVYNDDFVKAYFSTFQNTAEFEEALKKEYALTQILEYINKNAQIFKFPDAEYKASLQQLESIAPTWQEQYKMTLDEYLNAMYSMTRDEYIKSNMKTEMIFYSLRDIIGAAAVPTETEIAAEKEKLTLKYKQQYMTNDGLTEEMAISKANQVVATLGDSYIYETVMYEKIDDILPTQVKTAFVPSEKEYVFDAKTK